jgi:hypothetical protein
VETETVVPTRKEPVLRQPVPDRAVPLGVPIGAIRIPIAGPYRPWARLHRQSDGRLVWTIRLWETDRAVVRCVDADVLRTFARVNRLPTLGAEVEGLLRRATGRHRP